MIFSISPFLSWLRKSLCLSLSQMFCSTWMLAYFPQMIPHLWATGPAAASKHFCSRPPTDLQALLPGSQGTLWHILSLFFVYTGKGNLYPAASNGGRCLQNAQTLLHRGAEDGKRHPVYNARTLLPGEDPAYSNYDFHYLSYNVNTKPWVLMYEVLRGASQTISPNVLSNVVLQLRVLPHLYYDIYFISNLDSSGSVLPIVHS